MEELPNFDLNFDSFIWSDDENEEPQEPEKKRFKRLSEEEVTKIADERTADSTKRTPCGE